MKLNVGENTTTVECGMFFFAVALCYNKIQDLVCISVEIEAKYDIDRNIYSFLFFVSFGIQGDFLAGHHRNCSSCSLCYWIFLPVP
ncbi:hypothetical protein [Treponema zioleckii]|uniref:hypothetical protein n=1 Tax=Treponema zioleckii TaxID=331680 RepID=UPI00168ABEE9|nr:hypothetical protein [Treponema zioleckii]